MAEKKEVECVDLSRAEFEEQLGKFGEYSCSLPTGTTIGKRWFCNNDSYLHLKEQQQVVDATERRLAGAFPDWWQGEYAECDPPNPDRVRIIWRKVRLKE